MVERMSQGFSFAYLHCFGCAVLYVASLFLLVPANVRALPRDDILHIKYRMFAALIATILIMIECYFLLPRPSTGSGSYLEMMGLSVTDSSIPQSLVATLGLMCVFYIGPIVTDIVYLSIRCLYDIKYNGVMVKRESMLSPLVVIKDYVENE